MGEPAGPAGTSNAPLSPLSTSLPAPLGTLRGGRGAFKVLALQIHPIDCCTAPEPAPRMRQHVGKSRRHHFSKVLPLSQSFCLSIHPSIHPKGLSFCLPTYLFTNLSLSPPPQYISLHHPHIAPFPSLRPHIAPFCSIAPLKNKIAPWGAISPRLRTTALEHLVLKLGRKIHFWV
ncbi:hypothetical protein E2320_016970 [Naja naja]|nr:hypothetical protein E2320_016970 [Naja naja]